MMEYTGMHLTVDILVPLATLVITYLVMIYKLKAKVAEMITQINRDFVGMEAFKECQGAAVDCREMRSTIHAAIDRSLLSIRAQLATNSLVLARISKKLEIPEFEINEIERAVNRILENNGKRNDAKK